MELLTILRTAVDAIAPIVLIIGLGYLLRQKGVLTEAFVRTGGRLGFSICLPCSLFINVYHIESMQAIAWDMVIFSVLMVGAEFLLGIWVSGFATRDPRRRGVVLQCIFRSNVAIIGLPLAQALGGQAAAAATSIMIAFTLPVLNIGAVIALSLYVGDEGKKPEAGAIIRKIARNPLIHGILLGLLCLVLRAFQVNTWGRVVFSFQEDLTVFYQCIAMLGKIASPFMLLILGGEFDFSACRGMAREICHGVLWRTVLAPILVIGTAFLLTTFTGLIHCTAAYYPGMIALFGSPTAVSGSVMAGQMGNDEQLATQLVVWTSLASVATMFFTACILMGAGLIVP